MRRFVKSWIVVVSVLVVGQVAAQGVAPDPLASLVFPPELLMRHRAELGLTDEQVASIRGRHEQLGSKTQTHQRRLQAAVGRLAKLLSAEQVDEQAALEQLGQVLGAEQELKRAQLRLMIQIRNQLTAEQRQIAAQLSSPPSPQNDLPAAVASLSPTELSRELVALPHDEVPWRNIPWKSCLLEGLATSRLQEKPVVLWIFIDRPLDDERC